VVFDRTSNLLLPRSMHDQWRAHSLGAAGGFGGAMVNGEHGGTLAAPLRVNAIAVRGHRTCDVLWGTGPIAPVCWCRPRRRDYLPSVMVMSHVYWRSRGSRALVAISPTSIMSASATDPGPAPSAPASAPSSPASAPTPTPSPGATSPDSPAPASGSSSAVSLSL
jgi:hypothetical protein